MRVIAGRFRSRTLAAPVGIDTRPTSDRLKETLFNVLTQGATNYIEGGSFMDLYAGSGAVGIEALSRGAATVTFVESGKPALVALEKNMESLGLRRGSSPVKICVEKRSVTAFLKSSLKNLPPQKIDVVFLDPPYDQQAEYEATLGLLGEDCFALLSPASLVVAEHRSKETLAESFGRLTQFRVLVQGDAALSFYRLG